MEIDKELYKEIKEYCELNGLKARDYIHNLLKKAFISDKYGDRPMVNPIKIKKAEEGIKAEENFDEIVKCVGGDEKYQKIVSDLIFERKTDNNEIENVVNKNEKNIEKPVQELEQKKNQPKTKRKIEAK